MLLNCGVGEDSWESLGLQGDPTSPFWRRSALSIHWKDWCWTWNYSTLTTWCEELTHLTRPWCWKRLKVGGEGDNRGWDGWISSLTQCTKVWVNSGMDTESWRAAAHAVTKSWTLLSDWTELIWLSFTAAELVVILACSSNLPHKHSGSWKDIEFLILFFILTFSIGYHFEFGSGTQLNCICFLWPCMLSCSVRVQLFETPWTVAHQAPLSMWFSRQEYWSELPFLYPGPMTLYS